MDIRIVKMKTWEGWRVKILTPEEFKQLQKEHRVAPMPHTKRMWIEVFPEEEAVVVEPPRPEKRPEQIRKPGKNKKAHQK